MLSFQNVKLETNIGVYLINDVDGKIYVGSSSRLVKLPRYKWPSRLDNHYQYNLELCRNDNTFDISAFSFTILEYLTEAAYLANKRLLLERERYWQDYYDVLNVYSRNNMKAKGFRSKAEYSADSQNRRSIGQIIRHSQTTHEARLSRSVKHKLTMTNKTEEQKQARKKKISDAYVNKSEELKLEHKKNLGQKVQQNVQIDGQIYHSIKHAAKCLQCSPSLISKRCNDDRFDTYIRLSNKRSRIRRKIVNTTTTS